MTHPEPSQSASRARARSSNISRALEAAHALYKETFLERGQTPPRGHRK